MPKSVDDVKFRIDLVRDGVLLPSSWDSLPSRRGSRKVGSEGVPGTELGVDVVESSNGRRGRGRRMGALSSDRSGGIWSCIGRVRAIVFCNRTVQRP